MDLLSVVIHEPRDPLFQVSRPIRRPLHRLLAIDVRDVAHPVAHARAQVTRAKLFALRDPQAVARDMIVETDHPVAGTVRAIGAPVKFGATPGGVTQAAPTLGQHGRDILSERGYLPDRIEALVESGALVVG